MKRHIENVLPLPASQRQVENVLALPASQRQVENVLPLPASQATGRKRVSSTCQSGLLPDRRRHF